MAENNLQDTCPGKNFKLTLRIILIVLGAYYLFLAVAAPVKKLKSATGVLETEETVIIPDTGNSYLLREKLFLESRIELAGYDSAGISIDLISSMARLELKGVSLQSFDIKGIKYGNFFRTLDNTEYSYLLMGSSPAVKQRANFKKEPVRIIDAPRDTTNLLPDFIPADTANFRPSHATLQLENGITVILIDDKASFIKRAAWDIGEKSAGAASIIKYMTRFRIPDYNPVIKLYLSGNDIRTIYRAIPEMGRIAIRI